jgi:2-hydroxy-6-oxonona-2,4-dienedioate hydrolase
VSDIAARIVAPLAAALLAVLPAYAQHVTGAIGGFEPHFVDVDGIRTRYYDLGDGEPMVLVHGSGFTGTASANDWTPTLEGFARRFRVLAVDKLGSGLTGNPADPGDLTIAGEVDHLAAFIRTLELGPVHLVGHSRGAAATLLLAVNEPELVKTLILVSSASAGPPAGEEFARRRGRLVRDCPPENERGDGIRCSLASFSYDTSHITDTHVRAAAEMRAEPKSQRTLELMTPAQRRRNAEVTSRMLYDAYHRIGAEGALGKPVLLYWSKDDPQAVPAQGVALFDIIAEANPQTRLLMVNRAGHAHFRELPDEFVANVTHFVTSSE